MGHMDASGARKTSETTDHVFSERKKNIMSQIPQDTLMLLGPPIRLRKWLDQIVERKRNKGEDIPDSIVNWMDRWKRIVEGEAWETDCLTKDEVKKICDILKQYSNK
jgi:hypothetical protein